MSDLDSLDACMQPATAPDSMVYGDLFAKKSSALNRVKPEHLALAMRKIDAVSEREVVFDGRKMLMLSSNNHLGLAAMRACPTPASRRFRREATAPAAAACSTAPPNTSAKC